MTKKTGKNRRITIYDIAKEVGIAPSSVSKALNDLPTVSAKVKTLVQAKARELNYKHNSNAASLRRGKSKTIGVIVPKINIAFFSEAIAGMEEACFENGHSLIICQSDESFSKEVQSVETLIRQNVDCIIISLSQETKTSDHLQEIINHHLELVQFDRADHQFESHTIVNDNLQSAYLAVNHLIQQGFKKIAFMGGSEHLVVYKERKEGYIKAIKEAGLSIPYNFLLDQVLKEETALKAATELLAGREKPDAFFTVTDHAALGVLKAARQAGIKVPEQLGIVGFSNEAFTDVTFPTISSVDQRAKKLGKAAANMYFKRLIATDLPQTEQLFEKEVIDCVLIIRESSQRNISL